ncbi:hypothetical protein CR513_01225, partial [Mucuna pruriens]
MLGVIMEQLGFIATKNFSILAATLNKIVKSKKWVKFFKEVMKLHKPIVSKKDSKELCGVSLTLSYPLFLLVITHGKTEITNVLTKTNGITYVLYIPQTNEENQESNLRANSFKGGEPDANL